MINNPPPLRIPRELLGNRETAAFLRALVTHIYYQWERTGGGSGSVGTGAGGTGGTTAAEARQNLGVEIGVDVQAYDAGLASIAGLTTAANQMIYLTASDTYAATTLTSAARALLDDTTAAEQRITLSVDSITDGRRYALLVS